MSAEADGKGDVWTMDPDGGNKVRVTLDSGSYDYDPAWSPDGTWIVYQTTTDKKKGPWSLAAVPAAGGDPVRLSARNGRPLPRLGTVAGCCDGTSDRHRLPALEGRGWGRVEMHRSPPPPCPPPSMGRKTVPVDGFATEADGQLKTAHLQPGLAPGPF